MSETTENLRLVVIEGLFVGKSIELTPDSETTIGRSIECHFYLPDKNISRRHCSISYSSKGLLISDLNSSNGCFVNGYKVERGVLDIGDVVQIAKIKMQLERVDESYKAFSDTSFYEEKDDSDTANIIYAKEKEHPTFTIDSSKLETLLLHEVGKIIQREMPIFKMLGLLLEKILVHLGAKRGYIGTPSQSISIFRSMDKSGDLSSKVFLISNSVVHTALKGIGTISADATRDDRFPKSSSIHELSIRSILCVPIQGHKEILGAIYLDTLSQDAYFEKENLDLLSAVGKQTGIAIERRWREEEALRQSEAKNRALLNAIPDLLLCLAADGTIQSCKQAKKDSFLREFDKKVGQKIHHLFPIGGEILKYIPQVLESDYQHNFEYQFVTKDQLERYCEVHIVKSDEKEVLVMIRDITKRKQMQEAVVRGKMEWQATFDAVHDLIFITDDKGEIQRCNFAASKYLNREYNDLLGFNIQDFFGKEVLQRGNFELAVDDKFFDVWCYFSNKMERSVYIARDITKRKELEKRVQSANKLSALGLFSAGIAHEIGNPLASISMLLQHLKRQNDPDKIIRSVTKMEKQIDRLNQIIKGISSFSKHPPVQPKTQCNLGAILKETVALLSLDPRSKQVDMRLEIAQDMPPIQVFADQIQQTVINICINAFDAMPEGGVLSIKTSYDDKTLCILISDTGSGIAPKDYAKIFTPFFSSKTTKASIGLGLYLSLNYIQAHGGIIDVHSEKGKGSTFSIHLPFEKEQVKLEPVADI